MTIFRKKSVRRAVVVLDLSRYGDILRALQVGQKMGAHAAQFLNGQIQELVRRAVAQTGADFKKCFVKGTGDGAILHFEGAADAEQFATALHELADDEHCRPATLDVEWRSFRVGIYTGEVVLTPGEIAGDVVGFAQRLESGARTGQIVIDVDSWAELPPERQFPYGPEEELHIKQHDPVFTVRRRQVVESAPWDRGTGQKKQTVWYLPDRDRNPHFVGRAAEIEMVRERLKTGRIAAVTEAPDMRSHRRITALVGLGGVGKTQTAVEYAFQYADDYEYIFFIHADDPGKIKRDYARIAKLLKLRPWEKGLEGFVQVLREWMGETSGWLLVVDNVDRPEQVAPYLPRNSRGHVLVTSRLQNLGGLALGALNPIQIGLFTPEESRELMLRLTGRTTGGNPAEEAALQELALSLSGLPVALEQAATYIRNLPCTFADYWREFNLRRTELFFDPMSRPYQHEGVVFADRDRAVATTWDINFRAIEREAEKRAGTPQSAAPDLLLVSAFLSPDDIPMDMLAAGARELGTRVAEALRGDGRLRVNEALHLLHQFSLIEVKVDTRAYRMHRLVQEVVRRWWMTQEQRVLWAKRVIGVLRRGTSILQASHGNWPDSLKDQHFASFVATVLMDEWKQQDFEFEEAAELLSQTGFLLTKVDRHKEANDFLERAIAIREKLLGPDHLGVAESLNHFANNLAEWGHNLQAIPYYERTLRIRIRKQGKDHPDIAQVHNDFGIAYYNLSKYGETTKNCDAAKKHYLEALRIWEKGGDGNLIGSALFNLAMLYEKQMEEKKAEEHYSAAHAKVANPHMRAHVCRLYGSFLAERGRDAEALPLLREGRKLAKMCFGDKSEMILEHNDAHEPVLRRLGLEGELKAIQRESRKIRNRLREGV